eukprot:1393974-Amphidinium_carterae.2
MCQQQMKPQTRSQGTQTTQSHDREISTTRVREVDDIFVYPHGRRYHKARECRAVTGAKSNPRQYARCQAYADETAVSSTRLNSAGRSE